MVNYGVYHFKSRWLETVDRFGHSELLPGTIYSFVQFFLFTGEVIYYLIVKTHFKRPSSCGYQFIIIRFQFFRNSHVVLSHIQRSQSQRWITATFITQLLSINCTIQESWGEFSDEADSLRGPRTAIKVPGVWRTSCYT